MKKQAIIFLFSDDVWEGQERGAVVTRSLRWAGRMEGTWPYSKSD